MDYIQWLIQILLVPLLAPLGIGVINKLKAKLQKRRGAPIMQPYRNLFKLFHKDEVISDSASWIFRVAPFVTFGVTLVAGASIPLFSALLHNPTSDLLALVYLLALGTFFLALAGMDPGSAFGGFGSSREMTLTAIAEAVLVLSVLPLVVLYGTTNLTTIAATGLDGRLGDVLVPVCLAFSGFMVALLAETKRYPFDNPDTHLELTMVHEAMLLEYSGKRLALMEWAAANKLFILVALSVNLFFPFGLAQTAGLAAIAAAIGLLVLKMLTVYIGIALLESLVPKLRFFRLSHLLFGALILNVTAIGLVL